MTLREILNSILDFNLTPLIEMLNLFNEQDLFIDDCCHLTPFSALKIAENLNILIYKYIKFRMKIVL